MRKQWMSKSLILHVRRLADRMRRWLTARSVSVVLGPGCDYQTCADVTRNLTGLQVRINGTRDAHIRFVNYDGIGVCQPDDRYKCHASPELVPWADIKKIYVY